MPLKKGSSKKVISSNIREQLYKVCPVCNKEFRVPPYRKDTAIYCSVYCHNKGQYEHIKKKCLECGKEFYVSSSRINKKYCSDICRHTSHITLLQRRKEIKISQKVHRNVSTSRTVRKYAFMNKEKKCEICGYNEYDFCLDVHHIDLNCNNNDISNLKILCCMCHRKFHKGIIDINGNKK